MAYSTANVKSKQSLDCYLLIPEPFWKLLAIVELEALETSVTELGKVTFLNIRIIRKLC